MNSISPTLTPIEYFTELIQSFPDLESEILEEDETFVHIKMECFASYTVKQIISMNWDDLRSCFEFQEQRMNRMDQYLRNALDVSYFETLLLGEAWRSMDLVVVHMGPKVLQGYTAYKNYYENLEKAYLRKLGKSDRA